MLDIRDIILIILVIIVIYLIYKTRNVSEKFDVAADINQAINNTYRIDLDAMRNLGSIANNILTNKDNLALPTTTTTTNLNTTNITSTGTITGKDITSTGIFTGETITSNGLLNGNTITIKNYDIRNYLIGAFIYINDPLYNKGDNLPTLLTVGKINLIKKSDPLDLQTIIVTKIIVNPGFRVKIWAGVFNNYLSISGQDLNNNRPFDIVYYKNGIYDGTTPAIVENTSNNQMSISPIDTDSGSKGTIQSIEVEMI